MISDFDDLATLLEAGVDDFVKLKMEYLGVYNVIRAKLKEQIDRQEAEVQALR